MSASRLKAAHPQSLTPTALTRDYKTADAAPAALLHLSLTLSSGPLGPGEWLAEGIVRISGPSVGLKVNFFERASSQPGHIGTPFRCNWVSALHCEHCAMSFSFVPGQSEESGLRCDHSDGVKEAFQGPHKTPVRKE